MWIVLYVNVTAILLMMTGVKAKSHCAGRYNEHRMNALYEHSLYFIFTEYAIFSSSVSIFCCLCQYYCCCRVLGTFVTFSLLNQSDKHFYPKNHTNWLKTILALYIQCNKLFKSTYICLNYVSHHPSTNLSKVWYIFLRQKCILDCWSQCF